MRTDAESTSAAPLTVEWLHAKLAAGSLGDREVLLAAFLGHAPSRRVLSLPPSISDDFDRLKEQVKKKRISENDIRLLAVLNVSAARQVMGMGAKRQPEQAMSMVDWAREISSFGRQAEAAARSAIVRETLDAGVRDADLLRGVQRYSRSTNTLRDSPLEAITAHMDTYVDPTPWQERLPQLMIPYILGYDPPLQPKSRMRRIGEFLKDMFAP